MRSQRRRWERDNLEHSENSVNFDSSPETSLQLITLDGTRCVPYKNMPNYQLKTGQMECKLCLQLVAPGLRRNKLS